MTTLNRPTLTDCMLQIYGEERPMALIVNDFKNKNGQLPVHPGKTKVTTYSARMVRSNINTSLL